MSSKDKLLVCKVGGSNHYGNMYEYAAARLNKGDRVVFNGKEETVEYTWFYDGPVVKLANGTSIHPELGDTFELVRNAEITGAEPEGGASELKAQLCNRRTASEIPIDAWQDN